MVWIDETATYLHMTPTYARAPRGKRAVCRGRRRAQRYSLIVAMTAEGILTRRLVRGGMKRRDWLAFLEQDLIPALGDKTYIIQMDNLDLHKDEDGLILLAQARKLVEFQPPYSPESNPIEESFSKLKQSLRKSGAKTLAELREAIQRGFDSMTSSDFANWITHSRNVITNW